MTLTWDLLAKIEIRLQSDRSRRNIIKYNLKF